MIAWKGKRGNRFRAEKFRYDANGDAEVLDDNFSA